MVYNDRAAAPRTSSQQAGHKTIPAAPPKDKSRSIRPPSGGKQIPSQERERMIAAAAYFRAEQRGFAPGAEMDDWLQAEAEVDRLLQG